MQEAMDVQSGAAWTDERRALIRRTICPKGIPDDEFLLFMEQCRRSGLDPLLKQAFCVARTMKTDEKEKDPNGKDRMEQWKDKSWHPVFKRITRYEFQPSEAGMLARAERFRDFEGITSSEVYAEDEIRIDYEAGVVKHVVVPTKRKGGLVGAWARIQRKGKVPVIVWLDLAAMMPSDKSPLWAKMPAVMIRKCARVAALRTAYPEAFGGLYIAGERPEDSEDPEGLLDGAATPGFTPPPTLPVRSASSESAPTLEEHPPEARELAYEPVGTNGDENTPKSASNIPERPSTGIPLADSILSRAEEVKTEAARIALCEEARELPRGEARRKVADALEKAKARLFAEKAAELKKMQAEGSGEES